MRLPTTFLVAITTTFLFSSSALAQQNATSPDPAEYQIKCLRFPPTVAGNTTLQPEAISALSTAFSENSFNPPLPSDGIKLSPGRSSRVGWAGSGGFQVCVRNFWFFKTVTVSLDELSQAVAGMRTACCDGEQGVQGGQAIVPGVGGRRGKCQDSKAIVKAVDGSGVKVVAQDYGDQCCGMWGC